MTTTTDRDLFRHTLATLAYRAGKALRDVPDGFGDFRVGPTSRTPVEIVSHLGDLMEWGLSIARGEQHWSATVSSDWDEQVERFFRALAAFDDYVASDAEIHRPIGKLFQGPVADALTHVGQITMLRRLVGSPVRGENYYKADVEKGRVGADQAPPRYEFD